MLSYAEVYFFDVDGNEPIEKRQNSTRDASLTGQICCDVVSMNARSGGGGRFHSGISAWGVPGHQDEPPGC